MPHDLAAANMNIFLEDGPRLSTRYNTWVEVKCTEHGRQLVAGLGAFGHGRMWCDPIPGDTRPTAEAADDCNAKDDFGSTCQVPWWADPTEKLRADRE